MYQKSHIMQEKITHYFLHVKRWYHLPVEVKNDLYQNLRNYVLSFIKSI